MRPCARYNTTTKAQEYYWFYIKASHCCPPKGQLILKGHLGILEFFQKMNERIRPQKNSNSFVRFLEESSAWKNHFDIVWPLLHIPFVRSIIYCAAYGTLKDLSVLCFFWSNWWLMVVKAMSTHVVLPFVFRNVLRIIFKDAVVMIILTDQIFLMP